MGNFSISIWFAPYAVMNQSGWIDSHAIQCSHTSEEQTFLYRNSHEANPKGHDQLTCRHTVEVTWLPPPSQRPYLIILLQWWWWGVSYDHPQTQGAEKEAIIWPREGVGVGLPPFQPHLPPGLLLTGSQGTDSLPLCQKGSQWLRNEWAK